jgi:DNA-binding protein HU-beta
MSKSHIAEVIANTLDVSHAKSYYAAGEVIDAIVKELKKNGKFKLPGFGTFVVHKTKARKAMDPRTGATIKVKAGKTVRFKASPLLRKAV